MKREIGLLLAGAACFDIGTAVVAEAKVVPELQPIIISSISKMSSDFFYLKLTSANLQASSATCKGKGGKLVSYQGSDYCQIPKAK